MKMKHIAFALLGMSLSATAFAAGITPQQIEQARVANTLDQAWITGASAPTKTIYEAWAKSCAAGTMSIFSTSTDTAVTPGSLGNFNAYACRRGTRMGVLYHTVDGGSVNAFSPHTIGTKLARIAYAGRTAGAVGGCSATTLSYVDSTNTQNNATVYKSCARIGSALPATGPTQDTNNANAAAVAADANAPQQPVGGFSDVEAALLPASLGGGSVASSGSQINAFLVQGFGVAVSIPLYRKLQEVQNITETSGFAPSNAPSLTKAQITSILQDNGAVERADSWRPILGDATGTEKVIVQRRVNGSGTQSASDTFFMGRVCLNTTNALVPAAESSASGLYRVVLNSGSGDVKTGITTASNNTNPDDRFAIGVLSLENDFNTDNSSRNGYRFIKIDGVHPEEGDATGNARVALASGKYPFAFEMKAFTANSAPAGFQRNIVSSLVTNLRNPSASQCALLPRGIALAADGGNTSCQAGVVRATVTKLGNNCSPARLFN